MNQNIGPGLEDSRPLALAPVKIALTPRPESVLVRFDSVIPGVPLSETVWDNWKGPWVDPQRTNQISFVEEINLWMGMFVNLIPNQERIIIPFGHVFQEEFQSGMRTVFTNSAVFLDEVAYEAQTQPTSANFLVQLKVKEFKVWENPVNHLNLKAVVGCTLYRVGTTNQPVFAGEVRKEFVKQYLNSVWYGTPQGALKKGNKILNEFTAGIVTEIIGNLGAALEKS